jgi:hypothetical protein
MIERLNAEDEAPGRDKSSSECPVGEARRDGAPAGKLGLPGRRRACGRMLDARLRRLRFGSRRARRFRRGSMEVVGHLADSGVNAAAICDKSRYRNAEGKLQ